ncbi:MAG: sugar nucleotide-binding protein, partial [Planctomycetaceae bacterium]|nr:sugar nucleotide-binding protein [Planctomycetaceae bacterium]
MDSKILVIGSSGMLGQALRREIERRGLPFAGIAKGAVNTGEQDIDITDSAALLAALNQTAPDIIINTAAIVDCNVCENNPGLAYRINARPSSVFADWTKKHNAYYVYISTDHYYTGDGNKQHKETDAVTLLNEYARTKYVGEVLT